MELMKSIPDESIDLVVTDPPYRLSAGGCKTISVRGFMKHDAESVRAGKMFEYNDIAFETWLPEVYRVLKPGTHCYIMVNGRNLAKLQTACESAGFRYQNLLVWDKGRVTPNRYYMNRCEFILLLRKGPARTINKSGTHSLLQFKKIHGTKKHPTEKPVPLLELLISNSSDVGEYVLDPFIGAGSTCMAAARTGRHYIGFEIDEKYFNVAKERIMEVEDE